MYFVKVFVVGGRKEFVLIWGFVDILSLSIDIIILFF